MDRYYMLLQAEAMLKVIQRDTGDYEHKKKILKARQLVYEVIRDLERD